MSSIVVRLGQQRIFSPPRRDPHQRRWAVYELAKQSWDAHHPNASPAERDAAIVEITRRLGI